MFACYYPQQTHVYSGPEPTFPELRQLKLNELGAAFYTASLKPSVQTAAGWLADASEASCQRVTNKITELEAEGSSGPVSWCGYDNTSHDIDLDGLKDLRLLIIAKNNALRQKKWDYRAAIGAEQNKADLAAIVISFA